MGLIIYHDVVFKSNIEQDNLHFLMRAKFPLKIANNVIELLVICFNAHFTLDSIMS